MVAASVLKITDCLPAMATEKPTTVILQCPLQLQLLSMKDMTTCQLITALLEQVRALALQHLIVLLQSPSIQHLLLPDRFNPQAAPAEPI